MIGPSIYYAAGGSTMLFAYYAILAFPLAVVVPYSAFRSLAAEREDNTYDLLSITALKPRQIISGKLGSAVVQMIVYFSAISPCLAFTYLLRGVDVPSIAILLTYTFLGSLGLSMVGLLLAASSKKRVGQVFLSVLFVSGLMWAFGISLAMATGFLQLGYTYLSDSWFWISTLVAATFYGTMFALAFFASAGLITFTSENRSTPLRLVMLLQQASLLGWFAYFCIAGNGMSNEAMTFLATLVAIYWAIMGAMLTSEQSVMSQRIKRSLPQSFLGRLFLTWLNPGPCSGYMFVVANLTSMVLLCVAGLAALNLSQGRLSLGNSQNVLLLLLLGWGYLVAYLGLGRIVIATLRKFTEVSMVGSVLIHVLLLLAGSGIPFTIQMMSVDARYAGFTYLQISNPFWSLPYLASGAFGGDTMVLLLVVLGAALCALLLNLRATVDEIRQVRVHLPTRVAEDEVELHPPPEQTPANPWEE